jgi:TDG/mug DNA glycosylase family protein
MEDVTLEDTPVATQDVPDYLRPGLKLVIVGINPGVRSGAARRHYAFRGNHFWPLMFNSGLLPVPLTHENDERVLEYDIGLTNLVDRTTPGMDDLTWDEMRAAADGLRAKLLKYRPRVVCFNGMGIYQAFVGSKKRLELGLQPESLEGILMYVVPSSSGRTAAYQMDAKLTYYRQLKELVDKVSAEATP